MLQKLDTLVSEVGEHVSELSNISNRANMMLTCYPGGGARYVCALLVHKNNVALNILCLFSPRANCLNTATLIFFANSLPLQVKHTDNHCSSGEGDSCNGRRLTALIYLNPGWEPPHGGCIRIYGPKGVGTLTDVEPRGGRLLLFFSDIRVPHEVCLACIVGMFLQSVDFYIFGI